ncbi:MULTISPECIES: RNA-binding S4 domain-containing protein [unclassified Candidatus Frackibacter]|uniref:RNA-binding S4 domain-containing protein n=1 Tax=unclassified Candidatus Frackibacter TaxID=2648818 RepID=UPI000889DBF6|nr:MULTISPECIES: RNA-binding S4 domain-containing protein [unclassified Candidatus Frackibacter]SDC43577.1 ribosome-associated protein [Candidatus Frackibacter sp. WG11]SEM63990.1 ribosome-associated protein [Candidatus Frackibacter sp. WG12]SFL68828.1 ribosome-associated protein [Candidatus Frackibacter sp. WG13]
MKNIAIKTDTINLDQFLKWANLTSTGGEAKLIIKEGKVMVNGEIEERRSATLYPGDVIEIKGNKYKVTSS